MSEYERHRNFVIAELQGNRNPIIDHPDWARRIHFAAAWAYLVWAGSTISQHTNPGRTRTRAPRAAAGPATGGSA